MAFQRANSTHAESRKTSLGVNNVEEVEGGVDRDQDQNEQGPSGGGSSRLAVHCPDGSRDRHADAGEKHGVGATQPVEQRDDGQASQRAPRQIGGVERGNVFGLACKNNREFQPGNKERNGGSQVNRGEAKKIRGRDFQRDRSAQHDHQHDRHDQCVERA